MKKLKMYRVLVYHGKHGDCYVSARTPEEMAKAYLYLFNQMDSMGYYDYEDALDVVEAKAYVAAKAGDGRAAKWLLDCRSGGEYETIDVEWVVVPE